MVGENNLMYITYLDFIFAGLLSFHQVKCDKPLPGLQSTVVKVKDTTRRVKAKQITFIFAFLRCCNAVLVSSWKLPSAS